MDWIKAELEASVLNALDFDHPYVVSAQPWVTMTKDLPSVSQQYGLEARQHKRQPATSSKVMLDTAHSFELGAHTVAPFPCHRPRYHTPVVEARTIHSTNFTCADHLSSRTTPLLHAHTQTPGPPCITNTRLFTHAHMDTPGCYDTQTHTHTHTHILDKPAHHPSTSLNLSHDPPETRLDEINPMPRLHGTHAWAG